MGKFAALESPSMQELPPEKVIFGRSSTMTAIQRSVEKAANADIRPLLHRSFSVPEVICRNLEELLLRQLARFGHC